MNRRTGKQLLIIGGHAKQFSQTQQSYLAAKSAGIGEAKVVLPEGTRKFIKGAPDCLFVPETKSGSFAKSAIAEIAGFIKESNGVLLAGEFSQNSETMSVLEQLLSDTKQPLIISSEIIESMLFNPQPLFAHDNRVLLLPANLLAKLAGALNIKTKPQASIVTARTSMQSQVAEMTKLDLVLLDHELLVHSQGQISATGIVDFPPELFGLARGVFATFYLQHGQKFEALTCAAHVLSEVSKHKNQGLVSSLKNLEAVLAKYSQ